MNDTRYAVVRGPCQIDPPFAARGKTVWPIVTHVAVWPPPTRFATRTTLLDGPFTDLRAAQLAFLGMIPGR